jgi:hypothetical protein
LTDGGDNQVFRIDSDYVGVKEPNCYYMTAYEAMAVPDHARPPQAYGAEWWAGLEAMFCYNLANGYLYLRYRDGRRPDGMRWSGGVTDHRQPPQDAGTLIMLYQARDVAVRNLHLRGMVDLVSPYRSVNVMVDGCKFRAFDYGVRVYGASQNTKVLNSDFNLCLLGTNACRPLAKISSENPYPEARCIAWNQYASYKFFHDESDSTHGCGMVMQADEQGYAKNNEFAHNFVTCCTFGADAGGDGNEFHHNRCEYLLDMAFQRTASYGGRNVSIHDNYAKEAGYTLIRWHGANQEAGENHVYNNRIVSIDQVADLVFLAPDASQGAWEPQHSQLRIWFYHNTFSGGNSVWVISDMLSMPGFVCINNLLANAGMTANAASKKIDIRDERFGKNVKQWPAEVGPFDYNAMGGALGAYGSWYGPNNITNMPTAWPTDVHEEDCSLPDGHPAKASGIDISRPFVLNSVEYPALPGFEPGYFLGAAPDRGWINRGEDGGDIVAATLRVIPDRVEPSGICKLTWTGGGSAKDWFALSKVGEEHEWDKYLWAYTSSCGESAGETAKPSGLCLCAMPTELGIYEFHLYADDSHQVIATSNQVTVQETEPAPEPEERILAWIVPIRDPAEIKRLLRSKKPKS